MIGVTRVTRRQDQIVQGLKPAGAKLGGESNRQPDRGTKILVNHFRYRTKMSCFSGIDDHRRVKPGPVFVRGKKVIEHKLIDVVVLFRVLADERPWTIDEDVGIGNHRHFEGAKLKTKVLGLQGPEHRSRRNRSNDTTSWT